MTRFADTLVAVTDNARVDAIRKDQAAQLGRKFAPIQAKARANRDAMLAPNRGWLAIA